MEVTEIHVKVINGKRIVTVVAEAPDCRVYFMGPNLKSGNFDGYAQYTRVHDEICEMDMFDEIVPTRIAVYGE